jgi:putative flippase GtrA
MTVYRNTAVYFRGPFANEFVGYFSVSAVALAVDTTLLLLLATIMYPVMAATISFIAGLLVCYMLTVVFVFEERRFKEQKGKEATVFVLVGLAGLSINDGIIYFSHVTLLLPLITSKAVAATASFMFNFTGRKLLLFRAARQDAVVSR